MKTYKIEIVNNGKLFTCSITNNGQAVINIPVQDEPVTCCMEEEAAKHSLLRSLQNYARVAGNTLTKIEMIDQAVYETSKKV